LFFIYIYLHIITTKQFEYYTYLQYSQINKLIKEKTIYNKYLAVTSRSMIQICCITGQFIFQGTVSLKDISPRYEKLTNGRAVSCFISVS